MQYFKVVCRKLPHTGQTHDWDSAFAPALSRCHLPAVRTLTAMPYACAAPASLHAGRCSRVSCFQRKRARARAGVCAVSVCALNEIRRLQFVHTQYCDCTQQ